MVRSPQDSDAADESMPADSPGEAGQQEAQSRNRKKAFRPKQGSILQNAISAKTFSQANFRNISPKNLREKFIYIS
jgi:hypothetical protein